MRYQERIYIQNENGAVRNKDILNINMSSDICVFESPLFNLSGASKIDCSGTTGTSYVISTATTIPLTFEFTANTDTFTANSATFKYEIYKFDTKAQSFLVPPVYQSDVIQYSAFSATSATTQNIPVNELSLDGDYLVKGYYMFNICTDFMNRLGKTYDTLLNRGGTQFGIYDKNLDYYFIALKQADIPQLAANSSNVGPANALFQQVILPKDGERSIVITNSYVGAFIVTLNGLVLAQGLDYTFVGNIVNLSGETVSGDIITIIYATAGGSNLIGDTLNITSPVASGVTNGEGTNKAYFDTTTGKYELFTTVTPSKIGTIIVMINGATLANGIDYYQSISNPKRIILNGNLLVGDVIVMAYFGPTNVVNGLITSNPVIVWTINTTPQLVNGYFSLETSTGTSFTTLTTSGYTPYVVNQTVYSDTFTASGNVGTMIYYRIKNEKNYTTLCGDIVTTTSYSETIPLTVQVNSINSY